MGPDDEPGERLLRRERLPRRPDHDPRRLDERQYIAVELADHDGMLEPVEAALIAEQARDLAFRLLMLAELADHRARGEQL